jgi:WD40 repeat protein
MHEYHCFCVHHCFTPSHPYFRSLLSARVQGLKLTPRAGRVAKHMAELPADLTPVAAEAGVAEGDPRPVYTWAGPARNMQGLVRSYTPSDGGAPRLVVLHTGDGTSLGVWNTGTGALLQDLKCRGPDNDIWCLMTYQRASDGRPRVAAGSEGGYVSVWDGDDFRVLQVIQTNQRGFAVRWLTVYEEPASGGTRLVTG